MDRHTIGRANRRRGADFERRVVNYLRSALADHPHITVRRRMQWSGNGDPDVGVYAAGYNNPIWHIECKCTLHPRIDDAIKQAMHDAGRCSMVAVVAHDRMHRSTSCYVISSGVVTHEEISLSELADVIRDTICNTNQRR